MQFIVIFTVEDPSDGFIALRDMLDCQNCQTLPIFQPPLIHQPFTEANAKLAREKFKINKVSPSFHSSISLQAVSDSDVLT